MNRFRLAFRALFRPRTVEREIYDEIRLHIELETEKNVNRGMSPTEARRKALQDFGGEEAFMEKTREADVRGFNSSARFRTYINLVCLGFKPGLDFGKS